MRVPRKNFASKITLYYARLSWSPYSRVIVTLADNLLRKMNCSRREVFLDIPVYFMQSQEDLSVASTLLEDAAKLLQRNAPYWAKRGKNLCGCIMIVDRGPLFFSDQRGHCF